MTHERGLFDRIRQREDCRDHWGKRSTPSQDAKRSNPPTRRQSPALRPKNALWISPVHQHDLRIAAMHHVRRKLPSISSQRHQAGADGNGAEPSVRRGIRSARLRDQEEVARGACATRTRHGLLGRWSAPGQERCERRSRRAGSRRTHPQTIRRLRARNGESSAMHPSRDPLEDLHG